MASVTELTKEAAALVAWFGVYFIIPLAARMATGVIGNLAGIVNDRGKGAFDRLKKVRANAAAETGQSLKKGFDRSRLGSALAAGKHQRLARREALASGAIGVGRFGSARYRSALQNSEFGHMSGVAAESVKNNPAAAANDDANKIAQLATSRSDFIDKYVASKTNANSTAQQRADARAEAINQLTYTEQAFGTTMGTRQMRHTAATAALSSNSSTDEVGVRAQWMQSAVSDGIMTDSQAAALVKQSGSLASSAGFGDLLAAANGTMSGDTLLARASDSFSPANSHRMRKGQAQELGDHMRKRAAAAAATHGTDSVQFATAVANAAGIHDLMNGMTPDVREQFATELNGATVAGQLMRQHEADMETPPPPGTPDSIARAAYLDRRKTWAAQAAAAGGGIPGGVPGGGGGGGGGGAPGGAPAGGGAPSDIRLKRNIVALHQTPDGIQLYRFKYLWSDQEYVGVMAQDLVHSHPEALSQDELGYYRVNYGKLGLRMITIEEWEAAKAPAQSVVSNRV